MYRLSLVTFHHSYTMSFLPFTEADDNALIIITSLEPHNAPTIIPSVLQSISTFVVGHAVHGAGILLQGIQLFLAAMIQHR